MTKPRKPASFRLEEVEMVEAPLAPPVIATDEAQLPATVRALPALSRGWRWGSILLTAIGALVGLASAMWLHDLVREMMARQDWIGWATIGLLGLASLALVMIVLREAVGLARLGRLGRLRHEADSAAAAGDKALALDVVSRLKRLYAGRKDLAWGMARLAEHEGEILDAGELLRLSERTLVAPLDPIARSIVATSAKRVSVVTAVSPAALIDMLFVASENLRMLRRLATLYGARPGTLALLKLARMVVTHIVLTGGIALGDDVVHQLVGHGLTAKLSARLGEGLFNGALTTRIGLATIDVCRPLPYIDVPRPRFRELVAEVAGLR
ncbi:MAG: TIGR01620 family protein [Methyloceanibacter sp.]|jgi:putative membrane protein